MKVKRYYRSLVRRVFLSEVDRLAAAPIDQRFESLTNIAKKILPEYRFKWPYLDWWQHTEFASFIETFEGSSNFNSDRRWMVLQLIRLVEGVPGDTAECGVYNGTTSGLICRANENSGHDRTHFAFDSFEGLSEPTATDGSHWKKGDLNCTLEEAKNNLREFKRLVLLKGWIPSRFSEVDHRRFAFVHIDVDLYKPTLESIKFFYPRLLPGAILICDDYGSSLCPGATKAIDNYLSDKLEKMVAMSGGGGFMIKNVQTK
jgi:hypothetical protein